MCQGFSGFQRHGARQIIQFFFNQRAKCLDARSALYQRGCGPRRLGSACFLSFDGHASAIVDGQLRDQFFGGRVVDVE